MTFTVSCWAVYDIHSVLLSSLWYSQCLVELSMIFTVSCWAVYDIHRVLLSSLWYLQCLVELSMIFTESCWAVFDIYSVLLSCKWYSQCLVELSVKFTMSSLEHYISREIHSILSCSAVQQFSMVVRMMSSRSRRSLSSDPPQYAGEPSCEARAVIRPFWWEISGLASAVSVGRVWGESARQSLDQAKGR